MSDTRTITAESPLEAGVSATRLLAGTPGHRLNNLVIRIASPLATQEAEGGQIDAAYGAIGPASIRGVARTIMPEGVLRSRDWRRASERFHARMGRRTYFSRMWDWDAVPNVNQLERLIDELRRPRKQVDPRPIVFNRVNRQG